ARLQGRERVVLAGRLRGLRARVRSPLLLLAGELGPEQEQPLLPDHGDQMDAGVLSVLHDADADRQLLPGAEFPVLVPGAVADRVRRVPRSTEQVQQPPPASVVVLLMEAAHLEVADLRETSKIAAERLLDAPISNVVLYEVGLEFFEQLAPIHAPLRCEP